MYPIYFVATVGLLLLNLTGLMLLVRRILPNPALARATGVLGLCLVLFFVEHFVGLGRLSWVWPLTSLLSGALIWRARTEWRSSAMLTETVVFVVALVYGLGWRWRYPNIDGGSEHLTDLVFISNYLAGDLLPPPDRWQPGQVFDFYYGLQHYGAALMGRVFDLSAGTAMNMANGLLLALTASLGWAVAGAFIQKSWPRVLLVCALIMGGNGLAPFVPLSITQPTLKETFSATGVQSRYWASTRFSGMHDAQVNTELGKALFAPTSETLDLPLETISFYSYLGDYHPPQGGFALLLYALGLMALLARKPESDAAGDGAALSDRQRGIVQALLASTAVSVLTINGWVFPLQVLLVGAGLFWCWREKALNWRTVAIGIGVTVALIYPFFSRFAPMALPSPAAFVKAGQHTSLVVFLALHWPVLLLCGLGIALARKSKWALYLSLLVLALLVISELIYIDDPYGGKFERFNTTLKWWSWLWPAALVGLGSLAWGLGGRISRALVTIVCVAVLVTAVDVALAWFVAPRPDAGKFAGDGWLRSDTAHRSMLDHLQNAPKGIMLEDPEGGSYVRSSAFALFTGNTSAIGWPNHESIWRGGPFYINDRAEAARRFYRGELENAPAWLTQNQIRYVIWASWNDGNTPGAWAKISEQIGADYHWRAFRQHGDSRVGVWERR